MKRKNILFTLAAIALTTVVASCVKSLEDEGISNTTEYVGTVVEKSAMQPIPNVVVQVTDGIHVHGSSTTDISGKFHIRNINFEEINKSYYLWLDGTAIGLPTRREGLKGLGRDSYDYKTLVLYDKTDVSLLPGVQTGSISVQSTTTATAGGIVVSSGSGEVIERGVCYSTSHTPTIQDTKKTAGEGLGSFTCQLTGLTKNTHYYLRAYATNRIGTSYGSPTQFTTADGLPTVSTIAPTKIGTTVTTGGNVASDGGYPVTVRGVCYSCTPNPDITSAHNHTADGSGNGSFSSTFTMSTTGTYYIRAYATNANGTAYGPQKTINHPYNELPSVSYNGKKYRLAPAAPDKMSWSSANTYCNNLILYGYSDWRLPTKDELVAMYGIRNTIGGFNNDRWWSGTLCGSSEHYSVSSYNTGGFCESNTGLDFVRPIRMED